MTRPEPISRWQLEGIEGQHEEMCKTKKDCLCCVDSVFRQQSRLLSLADPLVFFTRLQVSARFIVAAKGTQESNVNYEFIFTKC